MPCTDETPFIPAYFPTVSNDIGRHMTIHFFEKLRQQLVRSVKVELSRVTSTEKDFYKYI